MLNKIFRVVLPVSFWFAVWHIASVLVNNSFMLPGIGDTFVALKTLILGKDFYQAVFLSLTRVIVGLFLGCFFGIISAILCNRFSIINSILTPFISVIRSTPVASIIVILYLMMSGESLTIFIGILMVFPIIWQSTSDGIVSIDKNLLEVSEVFEFSTLKKLRFLVLPALRRYLFPAIITSSGLAWKAEIAAEILVYTKNSIGQGINDAKYNMDTATVFAWTLVIIIFSLIIECLAKFLLRRKNFDS